MELRIGGRDGKPSTPWEWVQAYLVIVVVAWLGYMVAALTLFGEDPGARFLLRSVGWAAVAGVFGTFFARYLMQDRDVTDADGTAD